MYDSSRDPQNDPDHVTCPVCSEENWPGWPCHFCGFVNDGTHDYDQDDGERDDEPVVEPWAGFTIPNVIVSEPSLAFWWPVDAFEGVAA
jgi:hypothetical protein